MTQWQTESGSVVSISDARKRYAKSLSVALEPIQSGSGDPSPNNIRPISGRSSVTANRSGKNLLGTTLYAGVSYNPTVGADWSGRYVSVNQFTPNADSSVFTITLGSWASRAMFARVKPSTAYKLKASLSGEDCATTYGWLDENSLVLTKFNTTGATVNLNTTITSPNNAGWFYLLIAPRSHQQTLTFTEPQFEYSPKTDYEPYNGTSVTVQLGQTVYGASVDLVSGVMSVTKAYALLNDPSLWATTTGTIDFIYRQDYSDRKKYANSFDGLICSYMPVDKNTPSNSARWNSASGERFGINCSALTLAQIQSDATAGKIGICYELATPQTIQLTAHQIEMLMRNNTVWSDTGVVTLNYARIHQ